MDSAQRKQIFLARLRDDFNDGDISPEQYIARKKLLEDFMDQESGQSSQATADPRIKKGPVGADLRAGQGDKRGRMDSRQYSWAKSPDQVSPGFAKNLAANFYRELGPNPYLRSR
jgi:hypothetical protein